MRLYNPSTYSMVGLTPGQDVRHFNKPATKKSSLRPDDSWKTGEVLKSTRMKTTQVQPTSVVKNKAPPPPQNKASMKNQVHALKIVWPPETAEDRSADNHSLSMVPTTSTVTSSISPISDNINKQEFLVEESDMPTMVSKEPLKEGGSSSPVREKQLSAPSLESNEDDEPSKTPQKQRRRFASAFQSPLRLSKLQLRTSPKFLRRMKGRLQPENLTRSDECDPIFSSADSDENHKFAASEVTNGKTDSETPMFAFQTPIRAKFEALRKSREAASPLKSPQLSNNETHTTATSGTFDALPGRVSSESFYFDIDFVKSNDNDQETAESKAEPEEFFAPPKLRAVRKVERAIEQEQGSVVSKSSSSTITSHWQNEGDESFNFTPQAGSPTRKGIRPSGPAPWSNMNGFMARSEDGFVDGPLIVDDELSCSYNDSGLRDPQVEKESFNGNPRHSSAFGSSVWENSWSDGDGDSWIDFTADPFKSVSLRVVQKPCPSKTEISAKGIETTKIGNLTTHQLSSQRSVLRKVANSLAARVERNNTVVAKPPSSFKESTTDKATLMKCRGVVASLDLNQGKVEPLTIEPVEKNSAEETQSTMRSENLPAGLPSKYDKMLKMGLPEGAVRNAMIRDGFDPSVLDKKGVDQDGAGKKTTTPDPYRRFRVHWDAHKNVRSNTIWAMIEREAPCISKSVRVEDDVYNKLFRETTGDSPSALMGKKNNVHSSSRTGIIDAKRANNGGIVLASIKLSNREMARAIDEFEYDLLSINQIEGLLPFLPTAAEESALRSHISKAGGQHVLKSECEKFMAATLSVRDVKSKLEAMLFMKQFGVAVDGLKNDAHLVRKACEEVMGSSRLRKLLGVILEFGNRLNTAGQSSSKEKAVAIRLESLGRLSQGKAFDRKTTFLQFIASSLRRCAPDMLQLQEELPSLRQAARIDTDQIKDEVTDLESRITDVRRMALRMGGDAVSPEVEVEILSSTPLGRFALDSCLKMAALYHEMESLKTVHGELFHYFGEEESSSQTATPPILGTLASFCGDLETAVEHAISAERTARGSVKRKRLSHRPEISNTLKSLDHPHHKSGIGGVLEAIRSKAFSRSFDV